MTTSSTSKSPCADPAALLRDLAIEYRPVASLKPHDRNARTHSRRQIVQIAESIKAFGFTNPVLLEENGRIMAGHGRVAAAKQLGMPEVPTIQLQGMSEAQIRAYILADNKLAENAGWDNEIVKIELQHIVQLDHDFDLSVTGFAVAEIDLHLAAAPGADPAADTIPGATGQGHQSPAPVTSGSSAFIAFSALRRETPRPMHSCWTANAHR